MTYDLTDQHAVPVDAPPIAAPAKPVAGKRTRSERLPSHKRHADAPAETVMTDEPILDLGMACDGHEEADPHCPLPARAADRLLGLIQVRALEAAHTTLSVIGDVRTDLLTFHESTWGPGHELIFTVITTALFGPIASRFASAAARLAVPTAELGLTRAAWALADVNQKTIVSALTMISKSGRTALAHRSKPIPRDEVGFLDMLAELAGPMASEITDRVANEQMDQLAQLELLARLSDPAIVGRAAIRQRVEELLRLFRSNRLGLIGQRENFHGGYEVAQPHVVTFRGHRYMVLCESRGRKESGLALTGANLDRPPGQPVQTQESLRFVKLVESTVHNMVIAEYRAQRGPLEGDAPHWPFESGVVPTIDFDDAAMRTRHPWFGDFYVEVQHRSPRELHTYEVVP